MTADPRRRWLRAVAAAGLATLAAPITSAQPAAAAAPGRAGPPSRPATPEPPSGHLPFGRISPPLPVPDLRVTLDDGRPARLATWMRGRIHVMQLMFTGCSATCPIQGAVFAEVARQRAGADVRLLSFSIDGLGDTPQALRAWMARYGSQPNWRAAVPSPQDADRMLDFARGRDAGPDPHTAKVYLFNREAQLVYKTPDLPSVRDVVGLIDAAVQKR